MRTPILSRCLLSIATLIVLASVTPLKAADTIEAYSGGPSAQPVDPKMVIRGKAMARAQARAQRMAALDWYGYVPSRPRSLSTPLVGSGFIGRSPAYYTPRRPLMYMYR